VSERPLWYSPQEIEKTAQDVANRLEPSDYESALNHRNYWHAVVLELERQRYLIPLDAIEQCVLAALRGETVFGKYAADVIAWMKEIRQLMKEESE